MTIRSGAMLAGLLGILLLTVPICAGGEGLAAYYSCDKGPGAVLYDRSGNGNHGQIKGGASWASGPWGSALRMDGVDDYVDYGVEESLTIAAGGTVYLWFKPDTVCQGGLVGWTASESEAEDLWFGDTGQRFVISLNSYTHNWGRGTRDHRELGVYTSNGEELFTPIRSKFHKTYFPPVDEWTCLAVTYDGRNMHFYRNGVAFYAKFQPLKPATDGVPLWIGRCRGMGGPSDYFKGLIDEVRIYDRSLTDPEVYQLYMQDAEGHEKDTSGFESVTIKPTVQPKPGRIFADLDYRGLAPTSDELAIETELLDSQQNAVATGNIRMLPLWGCAEAVFEVQDLAAGDYTIRAVGSKGEVGTANVTWPGRAPGWEDVKVLNNLCWELLNESPGPSPDAQYSFVNPRRGWVYFITEAEGDLSLSVAEAHPTTIRTAEDEGRQEAMRWLAEGQHWISVQGDGTLERLIARAVPMLTFGHWPCVGPGTGDDRQFLDKYVLDSANTIISGGGAGFTDWWVNERGGQWIQILYRPQIPTDATEMRDHLISSQGLSNPNLFAVQIDEFGPGNKVDHWAESHYDTWCEVIAQVLDDPQYADHFIIPYAGTNMFDFEKSRRFVATIVEHDSYFAHEVYLREYDTADRAQLYINDTLAGRMDDWERAIPGATEHMIIVLSYLEREYWNPQVNFNVFMDMQFRHLATRPEFFGLAGIEEYVSHHSTEEYIRWAAKLYRHYGLEGNTERLGDDPYNVSHISNSDFYEGTDGWRIQPAEAGSIKVRSHAGYGCLEDRCPYYPYTETPVLWTRRSAERPNRFSQQIKNLEPGRLYSMRVNTGDYMELIKGESVEEEHEISIEIDNAELFTDWYENDAGAGESRIMAAYRVKPFGYDNRYYLNQHRRVFRATAPTAMLTISDWADENNPGGPIGQELVFNFIGVKPYLEY